jgi:hypothetical protein
MRLVPAAICTLCFAVSRRAAVRLQIQPLQQDLDSLITASLDRHAQRGQMLGTPPEPSKLRLSSCDLDGWCRVVDALAPFKRSIRRLETALRQRRNGIELVVENIADPWNLASVMRSAEALGVQHVHLVESVTLTMLPASIAHATARGSLGRADSGSPDGASRWLTIHRYKSTEDLIGALRERRLLIYASNCPTEEEEDEPAGAAAVEGMAWVTSKPGAFAPAVPIEQVIATDCVSDAH